MSVEALNAAIDEAMAVQLAARGFERARARTWWRKPVEPIYEMVEFQPRKGASYAGVWGWSLSMCPLQRGKSIKWKRTAASVVLDLPIDPANDDGQSGFLIDAPIDGYRDLNLGRVRGVVEKTAKRAVEDFRRVNSIFDLEREFEARTKRKYRGLAYHTWVQFKLAWSLAKRARGDEAGLDTLLGEWIKDGAAFGVKVNESMIAKANEVARSYAGNANVQA